MSFFAGYIMVLLIGISQRLVADNKSKPLIFLTSFCVNLTWAIGVNLVYKDPLKIVFYALGGASGMTTACYLIENRKEANR